MNAHPVRWLRLTLAGLAALLILPLAAAPASADPDITIEVTVPKVATGPFSVANAQFRWGINAESGSGAFFGECNFLSAGIVGDTGGGKVWTASDANFSTHDGAVTIEKPYDQGGDGVYRAMPFADRCLDISGTKVTTGNGRSTGVTAVIANGVGTVDPAAGRATITWRGSFTVVSYGGLAYWWITDPKLAVEGGRATLTATVGGYGSSRDDTTIWTALPSSTVTLATMSDVDVSNALGFTTVPHYRGVAVSVPAGETPQVRRGADWGAFPQSLVDFHQLSGQAGYFYSSGGIRDAFKPTSRLWVSYDAAVPVPTVPDPAGPATTDPGADPSTSAGAGGGGGGAGGAGGGPSASGTASGTTPSAAAADLPAAIVALAAVTVLPLAETLVPQVVDAVTSHAFTWALSGLLALLALTALAFQRGWLVWPQALAPSRLFGRRPGKT